jgi:hypothetical protein
LHSINLGCDEVSGVGISIRGIDYRKEVGVVRICTETMGNTYRHDWKRLEAREVRDSYSQPNSVQKMNRQ